ncbi:MAG: glycosyltransferase family 4 protein [Spirulinaceae cyanobacterium SM2_1_0]|nr:glycosyltransferase family 4 protein [Spirulinaceae cyanobacterium SM2_1_0]
MLDKHVPSASEFSEPWRKQAPVKPPVIAAKKLLILTQFYPPDYAATGQLICELATHLSRLGLRVSVFTGQPGYAFDKDSAPKHEITNRVAVRRSRTSRLWPLRIRGRAINGMLFCLRAAMYLLRPRNRRRLLLVTSEPPYLPVLSYLANCLFGTPYVCLLYDIYPDVAVSLGVLSPRHWLVRFWNWLNRKIWRRAQAAIVLSTSMRRRILDKAPELADKVTVIPSWADPEQIQPLAKSENWFAQQLGLTHTFTVQYSGNLGRCHDLTTLVAAAELLRHEPIEFVFIGRGAQLDACILQVQQKGLRNCRFLPFQDKSVLPYSLTACDLSLVSISPGLEGLVAPSKLYGILAAGRPVAAVCESHSYLRPLLATAQCGCAFDNGDAQSLANYIRKLAAQPELARALGQSGRRYLQQHFTPELVAKQYFQVLQASMGDAPVPRASIRSVE